MGLRFKIKKLNISKDGFSFLKHCNKEKQFNLTFMSEENRLNYSETGIYFFLYRTPNLDSSSCM